MSDLPQTLDRGALDAVIGRVVAQAGAEVLETMFFLPAAERGPDAAGTENPTPIDPAAPGRHAAWLEFTGLPSGSFWISVSEGVARELDASLLGRDASEVSAEEASQAVGELANIVCGLILSRLESEVIFRLSAPLPGLPAEVVTGRHAYRAAFDLESGDMLVSFEVDHEFDSLPGGPPGDVPA
jgi:CheY-specific phosphatase CheX